MQYFRVFWLVFGARSSKLLFYKDGEMTEMRFNWKVKCVWGGSLSASVQNKRHVTVSQIV